jgi:regulator of protease activity HflC (stomatin/prohibitin superfamily)
MAGAESDQLLSRPSGLAALEGGNEPEVGCCYCGICCTCISTGSVGVVQNLGVYEGLKEPGMMCYCPCVRSVTEVSLALQSLNCKSDCKTSDNVTVTAQTTIQYRIDKNKVKVAVFGITDATGQMAAFVDNVMRSTLPTMDLDQAFANKDTLCQKVLQEVSAAMAPYGYIILNVLVTDLRPEQSVLQAMNQINAAKRQREAAVEEGEAKKILAVKAAEADAEVKELSGQGLARMRVAMANGFKESMETMQTGGLSAPDAMHMMITTQYLDTLKEISGNSQTNTIMVPHAPGGVKDIEAQVRDGFVTGSSLMPPQQSRMKR